MSEILIEKFVETGSAEDYDAALVAVRQAERNVTKKRAWQTALSATSDIAACGVPVRADTYQGCDFGCRYCYAKGRTIIPEPLAKKKMRELERCLQGKVDFTTTALGSFAAMVAAGFPVHIGGMTDPFQPVEAEHQITLAALRLFAETEHPVILTTKGTLVCEPEYLALLKQCNALFQMSLVSREKLFEPYAPSFSARLSVIETVAHAGVPVIVRLQPFMFEVLEQQRDNFRLYAEAGVRGVIVSTVRMQSGWHYTDFRRDFARQFGYDLADRLENKQVYQAYSLTQKLTYATQLRAWLHEYGLQYLAADDNLRVLSDSANCCGTDNMRVVPRTFDQNITTLAYRNPDDFGFHLIKDLAEPLFSIPVGGFTGNRARARLLREHLQSWYNDVDWMRDWLGFIPTYHDGDDQHYRVCDEILAARGEQHG